MDRAKARRLEQGEQNMRFTQIKGLSERTELPRCGKVRLGERRKTKAGVEYPADLAYFKFDDETLDRYPRIGQVYADRETGALEPTELRIIFPVDDEAMIFPQALRFYGRKRGLRCIGDGEQAQRFICLACGEFECDCEQPQFERQARKCKCELYEQGKCSEHASLMFLLPDVTWEGCWQLDTGSIYNILRINSRLRFLRGIFGRASLIPLKLRRIPVELTHRGTKRVHHLLSLGFDGDTAAVRALRAEFGLKDAPRGTEYELPDATLDGDDLPAVAERDKAVEGPGGPQCGPATTPGPVQWPSASAHLSAEAAAKAEATADKSASVSGDLPFEDAADPLGLNEGPEPAPAPKPEPATAEQIAEIVALRKKKGLHSAAEFRSWVLNRNLPGTDNLDRRNALTILAQLRAYRPSDKSDSSHESEKGDVDEKAKNG